MKGYEHHVSQETLGRNSEKRRGGDTAVVMMYLSYDLQAIKQLCVVGEGGDTLNRHTKTMHARHASRSRAAREDDDTGHGCLMIRFERVDAVLGEAEGRLDRHAKQKIPARVRAGVINILSKEKCFGGVMHFI